MKVDGKKGSKWTVQKTEREKMDSLYKENWKVMKDESERAQLCATVYFKDRPFSLFWTVHFEPFSKNEFILQKITLH